MTVLHTYCAAFDHYDQERDPEDHLVDKVLPAEPGRVHAVSDSLVVEQYGRERQPKFLDSWGYERALCGCVVKVLLPVEFRPEDDDACPRCVDGVERNRTSPAFGPTWPGYDEDPQPIDDAYLDDVEAE